MQTGYDTDRRRSVLIWTSILAVLLVVGWVVVRPAISEDPPPRDIASSRASSTVASGGPLASDSAGSLPSSSPSSPSSPSTPPSSSTVTSAAPSTSSPTSTAAGPTPDASTSTSAGAPLPTAGTLGASDPGYATLPDGSPQPILVVYDTDTITISGSVPSEAAKSRLETLALANSRDPEAVMVSLVDIDPDVPVTIGVRVVEKTSARFEDGAAEVHPAHAAELDRIVAFLTALDHVTVLVIGHADQRGDEAANYELSERRAQAVVRYFVEQGIDPARLSSRAVGENDLLTLNDDATALALNRRTEFVLYGILADPAG